MRPSQRLADVLAVVFITIGVLNFFSPAIGLGPRDPLITYMFVGLAAIIFGIKHGGPRGPNGGPPERGPSA